MKHLIMTAALLAIVPCNAASGQSPSPFAVSPTMTVQNWYLMYSSSRQDPRINQQIVVSHNTAMAANRIVLKLRNPAQICLPAQYAFQPDSAADGFAGWVRSTRTRSPQVVEAYREYLRATYPCG